MLNIVFIKFKKWRSTIGAQQTFPMLFLPRKIIFNNYLFTLLSVTVFVVFNRYVQQENSVAVRYISSVSIRLLLIVVFHFPNNIIGLHRSEEHTSELRSRPHL